MHFPTLLSFTAITAASLVSCAIPSAAPPNPNDGPCYVITGQIKPIDDIHNEYTVKFWIDKRNKRSDKTSKRYCDYSRISPPLVWTRREGKLNFDQTANCDGGKTRMALSVDGQVASIISNQESLPEHPAAFFIQNLSNVSKEKGGSFKGQFCASRPR